jgi:Flp pilus assembly pilin Flp
MLKRFVQNESGATAIEYTLIAAAMGGLLVIAMGSLQSNYTTELGVMKAKLLFFK